jgi:hypothetical protein
MTKSMPSPVLLTVRGSFLTPNAEAARKVHNETAGSEAGKAAARALGDLSHRVYLPCTGAGAMAGTTENDLLFVDVWEGPQGIMEFFSNPEVQKQGAGLFTKKEPNVWMPAIGAYSVHMTAPAKQTERYLGVIRSVVASPEAAIEAFRERNLKHRRDARRRGHLSHELFFHMAPPGVEAPPELLGIDTWCSLEGMLEHYKTTMGDYGGVFPQKPTTSIWQEAGAGWSEW